MVLLERNTYLFALPNKSAFSSYKNASKNNEEPRKETMDSQEEQKELLTKVEEPRLGRKRTQVTMQKDFKPQSSQLLLSSGEDFPPRKRAKSF